MLEATNQPIYLYSLVNGAQREPCQTPNLAASSLIHGHRTPARTEIVFISE